MSSDASPPPTAPRIPGSSPLHAVLAAACGAVRDRRGAALALVLETDGSTYAQPGAMALFGPDDAQLGWLSGGCLEPEIAVRARRATATSRIEWMEVDTRDDAALMSGAALGCRGRLRLVLLPLAALPGIEVPLQAWCDGGVALRWTVSPRGGVALDAGDRRCRWQVSACAPDWPATEEWTLRIEPPPELLLCGGGPEAPLLLSLLRDLGWRSTLVEARSAWRPLAALADRHVEDVVAAFVEARRFDAALVMHHNFERDLEALAALAPADVRFIGLLGPVRRREDLLRVLPTPLREVLRPRLHAPVGLDLGGWGAEAIALSIAAQLQAWRHGRPV